MRANAGSIASFLVFSCSVAALHGQKALSPGEQDQALAAIREYALNYAQSLPDYACTRVAQQKSSMVIDHYALNRNTSDCIRIRRTSPHGR
jgi:GAF domain-containing protein